MKNITFSADEDLIQEARRRAANESTTINQLFREWLARYVSQSPAADQYQELMGRLTHVQAGRKFDRDKMNERR